MNSSSKRSVPECHRLRTVFANMEFETFRSQLAPYYHQLRGRSRDPVSWSMIYLKNHVILLAVQTEVSFEGPFPRSVPRPRWKRSFQQLSTFLAASIQAARSIIIIATKATWRSAYRREPP